ncbi:MAG TPA: protease, partial [Thermoanaerobaculia bacterium]|nr:protease [Thermoanaerobaculia bacterium]
MRRILSFVLLLLLPCALRADEVLGYYRFPALHGDVVVFGAEGDLWRVDRRGGIATRLTTHPAEETDPAISPDGRTLAFSARYEGPSEVYTMPVDGGLPVRRTWEGGTRVVDWTPGGEILYATAQLSDLPNVQLVRLDPATWKRELLPLAQAADGSFTPDGKSLFFTRFAFQGSHTKRYKGGTAQNVWRFRDGDAEAAPLTADFTGTSKEPMVWNGRIYFVSDRDGTMNLWSMDENGKDLRQHTSHHGWDVASPSLSGDRIVYQLGADLRIFDIAASQDAPLSVRLISDFDQLRETWVQEPMPFVTSLDLSPSGDRVAVTARGQVFVIPVKPGRTVEVTRKPGVRYREARFLPDGKSVLALSDETGEVELWKLPANGVGKPEQLTTDGKVLRWEGVPSPDGKWIAHRDKNRQLWVLDPKTRKQTRIATSTSAFGDLGDLTWSPDSRWLAYSMPTPNTFQRLFLYSVETGAVTPLTSDRFNSWSPAWSRDGKWIYFLSDRELRTLVPSPWGTRQPEPYLASTDKIFGIALKKGLRSPFQAPDELHPAEKEGEEEGEDAKDKKDEKDSKEKKDGKAVKVEIDLEGLRERLFEIPAPAGNYGTLQTSDGHLFWSEIQPDFEESSTSLRALPFDPEAEEPATVMEDIENYTLSPDGKKLLVRKEDGIYVFDANGEAPAEEALGKAKVDLSGWKFAFNPREQWRQMFREAWRLERDYFYDLKMHGVDWPAMLEKYQPLSLRVTSRGELDDLLAQMVSELSALHTFVGGGEARKGSDEIDVASLGAALTRDEAAGGWRVERLYRADPDLPSETGPLLAPGVGLK